MASGVSQQRRAASFLSSVSYQILLLCLVNLAFTAGRVAAHGFPYTATQILVPSSCIDDQSCDTEGLAYIFRQNDGDNGVQFLSLNYTNSVNEKTELQTMNSQLPFLQDGSDTTAFTAVRTTDETIVVYAGRCDEGSGETWTHTDADGWKKEDVKQDSNGSNRGPYFLGGTIAFSSTIAPKRDAPTIYTYGGMCSSPSDSKNWQEKANYTKTMISLQPEKQTGDTSYSLSIASSSGPRTPIAGFSMTSLTPSMTNISGDVTQQAGFVVLGGHTQQAFINMSTAAVWNLPEETWSYVSILPPDARGSNELARGLPDNVYSRSGHTAVLSTDGDSIIVLGGWVGDVNTPAEPQLAILDLSGAYNDWRWKIPDQQPSGKGIYGHGAAVLPGGVMMVYGGWEVGSASLNKRQDLGGNGPQFFNLTSMAWSSSYTNPTKDSNSGSSGSGSGSGSGSNGGSSGGGDTAAPEGGKDSGETKKLGLGLGLGLGIPIIIAIVAALLFLCYRRRHNQEKKTRDRVLQSLSQDIRTGEMVEQDDYLPWTSAGWYTGGRDAYSRGETAMGYEAMRGANSAGYDQPFPATGPPNRKPVGNRPMRGSYAPAGAGMIHPILEDEDEDGQHHRFSRHSDLPTPGSEVHSDPFATPTQATAPPIVFPLPRGVRTPSPENAGQRAYDPDVQDWQTDVDAAEGMLTRMNNRQGRLSPTRRNSHRSGAALSFGDDDSRTGSNLSESSLKRSPSHLKAFFNLGGAADYPKPGSSSSSSYNTAKSSFHALQAEGPSLLAGRAPPAAADDDNEDDMLQQPGSPSKSKPRRGWLGSLRRVFSTSGSSGTPAGSLYDSPRRASFDMAQGDYEPPLVGLSGELLRRKQGRQDWNEKDVFGGPSSRGPGGADENEWDVERAVEDRLVQVMFTVPKERLRVVNAGENDMRDDESLLLHQPQSAELVDPSDKSSSIGGGVDITEARSIFDDPVEESERPHTPVRSMNPRELYPRPLYREQQHDHSYEDDEDDIDDDDEAGQNLLPRERIIPPTPSAFDTPPRRSSPQAQDAEEKASLLGVESLDRRMSHSSQGSYLSAAVLEAEAMTMHRPKTKVLQMVDTIESRHGSPTSPKKEFMDE